MSAVDIPQGWDDRAFLDLVTINSGQVDPRAPAYRGLPLIAPDHVASNSGRLIRKKSAGAQGAISGKYLVKPGDIIYSKIRPYLKKAYKCDFNALCSADMYPFTAGPGISNSFILHIILSKDFTEFAVRVSARSGIPKINRHELLEYRLPVPPPAEQRAIGRTLDDADALIAAIERLIAKKQEIRQGMMQQLLTSKTRLPGFSDTWESKPFEEVMTRLNLKTRQILASDYGFTGSVPVVDQGHKTVIGYTNDIAASFAPGADGVLVFGDHTCITKFIDFTFAVGADGTQIVKAINGNTTRFMFYALESDPVVATGYNRHFKYLKEKSLPAPEHAEQKAISCVLRHADSEIAALYERLTKARMIKTGMMQELLSGRTRLLGEADS